MALNEADELAAGGSLPQDATGEPTIANPQRVDILTKALGASSDELAKANMQHAQFVAKDKQPEQVARSVKLATTLGVAPEFAQRQEKTLSGLANVSQIDYDRLIKKAPGLSRFLQDPNNAALTRDDMPSVERIDRGASYYSSTEPKTFKGDMARAAAMGGADLSAAGYVLGLGFGLATPEEAADAIVELRAIKERYASEQSDDVKEFNSALARTGGYGDAIFENLTQYFAQQKDARVRSIFNDYLLPAGALAGKPFEALARISQYATHPRGFASSIVQNFVSSSPSIGTGVAGAAVGTAIAPGIGTAIGYAVGGFAGEYPVEVANSILEDLANKGISSRDDLVKAFKDPKIMDEIRARANRKAIGTSTVDALFNLAAGRYLKESKVSNLGKGPVSSAISSTGAALKDVGVQAIGGFSSEFAGQALRGGVREVNYNDLIDEAMGEIGSAAGEVISIDSIRQRLNPDPIVAAHEMARESLEAWNHLDRTMALMDMVKTAEGSKLQQRVPEKTTQLINNTDPNSKINFQKDEFDNYWRSKGLSPTKALEQLNGKTDGTTISVTVGDFVAKTAGDENASALLEMSRSTPEGPSVKEARATLKTVPEMMDMLAKESAAPEEAKKDLFERQMAQVKDDLSNQFVDVNVTKEERTKIADLFSGFIRSISTSENIDPLTVYREVGPQILREGVNITPERIQEVIASAKERGVLNQDAYHGTLSDFDQFDSKYIGTGTGARTFGWGFYSSQSSLVGEAAREFLAKGKDLGRVAKVDVPEDNELLNWDLPLSQQPDQVKAILGEGEQTGGEYYNSLKEQFGSDKQASLYLRDLGIPGLMYKNPGAKTLGSSYEKSYVVWDEKRIKQIDKNYKGALFQTQQQDVTQTPEFKAWFGDSKVVDEENAPKVVYHGTTHNIDQFSPERANIENDLGGGYYFTDSVDDVSANYAGQGPDLTNRIERRVDQLTGEGIDRKKALRKAKKELLGKSANVVPVYLSLKNPVILGGTQETIFETRVTYDDEGNFTSEEGNFVDFVVALRNIAEGEFHDHKIDEAISEVADEALDGISASRLIEKLKESEGLAYATDSEGRLASSEIIRRALEASGYDGIIDNTVGKKFGEDRQRGQQMSGVYGDTTHYIAFQPEQIKSIFNRGTFDPNDPKILHQRNEAIPLGFYDPTSKSVVALKKANLSTYLHEMSHYFMDIMQTFATKEGASDRLKKDFQTLLDALGVENASQLERKHQEQLVDWMTKYFAEGKAPSEKLRSAFDTFKTWLNMIFKHFKNEMGIELSDEVRGVFDRLIATDEEIQNAKQEVYNYPLFASPEAFGMTGKKLKDYQEAIARRDEASKEALSSQMLANLEKERKAVLEQERERIEYEVATQINNRPEYIALSILQKGKMPDGSPLALGMEEIKLDKAFIKDVKGLPKGISSKFGEHPDVAAKMLGFPNGEALLSAISNLPNREALIRATTDARMVAEHGDLLKQAELPEKAIEAIHNDHSAKVMRMELEHLISNDLNVFLDLVKRIGKVIPSDDQVKAVARNTVGKTGVRNVQPYRYQQGERKYGRLASEALAKGDFDGAFDAKLKQRLYHELYRSAVEARNIIDDSIESWKPLYKSEKDLAKTRDTDMVNAAKAILARAGIGQTKYPAEHFLEDLKKYDNQVYLAIESLMKQLPLEQQNFKDGSVDDFMAVKKTVDALWELSRINRQFELEGQKLDVQEVAAPLIETLNEWSSNSAKKQKYATASATWWERARARLLGVKGSLRIVESWADALGGGDPLSPFLKAFSQKIFDATTAYHFARLEPRKQLVAILETIKPTLTWEPIISKDLAVKGLPFKFDNKAQVIGALLHRGNESNLKKLLRGYGWGDVDENGILDTRKWDAFERDMVARGILTKADYDAVQAIWDLFEQLKPKAQKAHKALYGYYFNEITNKEFQTPFGTYRGGYVPAVANMDKVLSAEVRKEIDDLDKANRFAFPETDRGFTKARNESYAVPLNLDVQLLAGQLDKVVRFAELQPAINDVLKLIKNSGFKNALDSLDPGAVDSMLIPWLERTAKQRVVAQTGTDQGWKALNAAARVIRRNSALNIMFLNVPNTIQQGTGILLANTKVKAKHLRNAMIEFVSNPKAYANDVRESSKYMAARTGSELADINDSIDRILLKPNVFQTAEEFMQEHGYILQQLAQGAVDSIVWGAAYDQYVEMGLTPKEAEKSADSAVRLTQGSGAPEAISRFFAGTPVMRLFTMFGGYFNMQANLAITELGNTARELGLRKGAGRMLYTTLLPFMAAWFVSELITKAFRGGLDDGDDDEYAWEYLSLFFSSAFKNATGMMPLVNPIIQATVNRFDEKPFNDRLNFSPAVTQLEKSISAPYSVYKAIVDDGSRRKAIQDSFSLIGSVAAPGAGAVGKPLGYLSDVSENEANPDDAVEFIKGLIAGREVEK